MKTKAFQIAIEGTDGAGKGTQTDLLVKTLLGLGYKVARVSFPRYKDTWAGKLLGEALKSERAPEYDFVHALPEVASLLYAADRLESVPWLEQLAEDSDVIVYDRAVASNLIHQGGKFETDSQRMKFAEFIERVEYQSGFPRPDLTLFLSLPYEECMARATRRAEERGETSDVVEKDLEYMRNSYTSGLFYSIYLQWTTIDCMPGGHGLAPQQIHQVILHKVLGCLQR